MVERLRLTGDTAVPMGPVAPGITGQAGSTPPTSERWHAVAPLAEHTVRRLRRLDVQPPEPGGRGGRLTAHFRDSYQGVDEEMVMHEYLVSADLVAGGGAAPDLRIEAIEVDPRVLPWESCPAAGASAGTLAGTAVADLPGRVRAELVGPSTCTHLNSTMRSLADADALIAALERGGRV